MNDEEDNIFKIEYVKFPKEMSNIEAYISIYNKTIYVDEKDKESFDIKKTEAVLKKLLKDMNEK
jgi:hypothetical protein